mgnify:FL=1
MERCEWCEANEVLRAYHDREWGVPVHDDRKLFEFLMMEVMQCGLNWNMMLQKREIFRSCFDGFDYDRVAAYGEEKIAEILDTPGMIRSPRKIRAVIHDAQCFQKVRQEFGTFDRYLWAYTEGKTQVVESHQRGWVAKNGLSDRISADLKRRGFKYLGSVTVYAYIQSCGLVNDHAQGCFRRGEINRDYEIWRLEEDLA